MKKIFLILAATALMLAGCSGDDSSDTVNEPETQNPTEEPEAEVPQFQSQLYVGGIPFVPAGYQDIDAGYTMVDESDPLMNARSFALNSVSANDTQHKRLSLSLNFEPGQLNNTTFTFDQWNSPNASGNYDTLNEIYTFISGTVTVTDLGNNKFHLQFNNVICEEVQNFTQKTITGYAEGTFTVQ